MLEIFYKKIILRMDCYIYKDYKMIFRKHRLNILLLCCFPFALQVSDKKQPLSPRSPVKQEIFEMRPGLYRHYKGKTYQVVGVARHSETQEPLVVYQLLYGNYSLWVRPFNMFNDLVSHEGKMVKRFEFIADTFTRASDL